MGVSQLKTGREAPDHTIKCSYCNTLLPAYAKFCGFCGKRVKQKKTEEMETHTKHSSDEAQESDVSVRQMQQGPRLSHIWAFLWHALHLMIQKMRRKRVPQVSQMSMVECGLACLAMILS